MSQSDVRPHPVLAAAAAVDEALVSVVGTDPMYMSVGEKQRALVELSSAIDRLTELRARVLAHSADVAAEDGARDAAAWLAHCGRRDRDECRRGLHLGRSLAELPRTAGAVRGGEINVAQAEAVVRAMGDLPDEVGTDVRAAAEERLIKEAADFGPRHLRVLGRRVLEVVAPEVAEELEARLLEREEANAARRTHVYRRRNGDGTSDVRIRISDSLCDRLFAYLDAFTSPRREGAVPAADRRPYAERLGTAFAGFLEAIDPGRLPLHGGDATTVLVTIDLETLREALGGVAHVGDEPISAAEARRLACTAKIVPVVLGGASQVLDLGRSRRLFSPAQRKALAIQQRTCQTVGCDVPADWCEAHHAGDPWSRGGATDLADGLLLCGHHHRRAHDHGYRSDRMPDGRVRFHRRT